MCADINSSAIPFMQTTRPLAKTLTTIALLALSATTATIASAQKTAAPSKTAAHATTAPTAPREQTADQQVQHVLSRLAFGARPGDVQAVREMGVDAWISKQLEPQKISDAPMDTFLKHFPSLDAKGGELESKYPPPAQALARLAAQQGISRDSAKILSKEKGKKKDKNDETMTASATPAFGKISSADSLKIKAAAQESYRVVGELSSAKSCTRRCQRTPAQRSNGRLLGKPLQSLRRQGSHSVLPPRILKRTSSAPTHLANSERCLVPWPKVPRC